MTSALVLEDDSFSAMALNMFLEDEGFSVSWFSDSDQAVESFKKVVPDVLIADWQVEGDTSSAEVARALRSCNPSATVVFVSGYAAEELKNELWGLAPFFIFSKPLDYDELLGKIKGSA